MDIHILGDNSKVPSINQSVRNSSAKMDLAVSLTESPRYLHVLSTPIVLYLHTEKPRPELLPGFI